MSLLTRAQLRPAITKPGERPVSIELTGFFTDDDVRIRLPIDGVPATAHVTAVALSAAIAEGAEPLFIVNGTVEQNGAEAQGGGTATVLFVLTRAQATLCGAPGLSGRLWATLSDNRSVTAAEVYLRAEPGVAKAIEAVATLEVTPAVLPTLRPGRQLQLTVVARNAAGAALPNAAITYENSNPAAGFVSSTGKVIGLDPGPLLVTVRAGDASVTLPLLVSTFEAYYEWSWDEANTVGLDYAYRGGIVPTDAGFVYQAGGTISAPPSSFCAVYHTHLGVVALASRGIAVDDETWFLAGAVPMQTFETDADGIVASSVKDYRVPIFLGITPKAATTGVAVANHGWVEGSSQAAQAAAADAAIAAAAAAGILRVYFPANATLNLNPAWWSTIPNNFTVSGAGMAGSGAGGTTLNPSALGAGEAPITLRLQTGVTIEHFHVSSTGIAGIAGSKGLQFLGCTRCTNQHNRIDPGFNWGTFFGSEGATRSTYCVQDGVIVKGSNGHGTEYNGTDFCELRRGFTTATGGQGFENYWQVGSELRGNITADYLFFECGESSVLDMGAFSSIYLRVYCLASGSVGFNVATSDIDAARHSKGGSAKDILICGNDRDGVNAGALQYLGWDWHFERVFVHRAGGAAAFVVNGLRGVWTGCGAWYADRTGIYGNAGAVDCRFHGGTILNPASLAGSTNNFDLFATEGVIHLTSMLMDDTRPAKHARMGMFFNGAGATGSRASHVRGLNVLQLKIYKNAAVPIIRDCQGIADEG